MHKEQAQIHEFMVKAEQHVPDRPTMPNMSVRVGRLKWLAEELCELANAFGLEIDVNNRGGSTNNFMAEPSKRPFFPEHSREALVEAYDAVLDLMVFTVGTGIAMGTDLESGWEEVHRSNMAKFGPGSYKRADGKWMKPPGWQSPDLANVIETQLIVAAAKDKQLILG